jgi:hypothetical protein
MDSPQSHRVRCLLVKMCLQMLTNVTAYFEGATAV